MLHEEPFWKFGFFIWDTAKMDAFKLLYYYDDDNKPLVKTEYAYARWRMLMTSKEERRAAEVEDFDKYLSYDRLDMGD